MKKKDLSSVIFKASFQSFKDNFVTYILLAALLMVVVIVLGYFVGDATFGLFESTFYASILGLLYAKFAVAIHRSVLLSNQSMIDLLAFKWADIRFLIGILIVIASIVFLLWLFVTVFLQSGLLDPQDNGSAGFLTLLIFIMTIVFGVIGARLALLFPAIAINAKVDLKETWFNTRNHKVLLFFLIILFPYIISNLLEKIPEERMYWSLIGIFVSVFFVMFEVIMLSHCYSEIMVKSEDEAISPEGDM